MVVFHAVLFFTEATSIIALVIFADGNFPETAFVFVKSNAPYVIAEEPETLKIVPVVNDPPAGTVVPLIFVFVVAPVLLIVLSPEMVVQVGVGVELLSNICADVPAANLETDIAADEETST